MRVGPVKRTRLAHWEFLVVAAVASTMLSLVGLDTARSQAPCFIPGGQCDNVFANGNFTCSDGTNASFRGECNDLCTNTSNNSQCATFNQNLCLHVVCAGVGNCSILEEFVPPSCQDANPCTNNSCDVCANNCTGQCVITPVNASTCNLSLGAGCTVNG